MIKSRIYDHAFNDLKSRIYEHTYNDLKSRIYEHAYNHLKSRIYEHVFNHLKSRIYEHVFNHLKSRIYEHAYKYRRHVHAPSHPDIMQVLPSSSKFKYCWWRPGPHVCPLGTNANTKKILSECRTKIPTSEIVEFNMARKYDCTNPFIGISFVK